jgi:hypothetical protein
VGEPVTVHRSPFTVPDTDTDLTTDNWHFPLYRTSPLIAVQAAGHSSCEERISAFITRK